MKKEFVFLFSALLLSLSIPPEVWSQDHKTPLTDNPLSS